MKRKQTKRRTCLKKAGFVLIFLLALLHLSGQTKIEYDIPSQPVQVGMEPRVFKFRLINLEPDGKAISAFQASIVQPVGMKFVESLLQVELNGSLLSSGFTFSGNTIAMNTPINNMDTLDVYLYSKALCDIVPVIGDGSSIVSFSDVINYSYTTGSSTQSDEIISNSYNVICPDVEIFTPKGSLANQTVEWMKEYIRYVPIKNKKSPLDSLYFTINYQQENVLELKKVWLCSSKDTNTGVEIKPYADNGILHEYLLTSQQFSNIGIGSTLENEEEVFVAERYRVVRFVETHQTKYDVFWGSDGQICNEGFTNTTGDLNVVQYGVVNLNMTHGINFEIRPDYCNLYGKMNYVLRNNGTSFTQNALNIKLTIVINDNGTCDDVVKSVSIDGKPFPSSMEGRNLVIGFGSVDPDGPGVGLEDLDNDGVYDDLPFGQVLIVAIEFEKKDIIYNSIRPRPEFYRIDGVYGYLYTDYYDKVSINTATASGNVDIPVNTSTQYTLNLQTYKRFMLSANGSINSVKLKINLPGGLMWDSNQPVYNGTSVISPSNINQEGRVLTISGILFNDSQILQDFAIKFNAVLLCDSSLGEDYITWNVYFECGPCGKEFYLGNRKNLVVGHPKPCVPGGGGSGGTGGTGPCYSLVMDDFGTAIARTTFGYNYAYNRTDVYPSMLTTASKLDTSDHPDVHKAMRYDTVMVSLNGLLVLHQPCEIPGDVQAKIVYKTSQKTQIFNLARAVCVVNGTAHALTAADYSWTASGDYITCLLNIPSSILEADSSDIEVLMYFFIPKTTLTQNIEFFRGQFISSQTSSESWGDYLQIGSFSENNYVDGYSNSTSCSEGEVYNFTALYQNISALGASEFRNYSHVNGNITISIPQGYKLSPSNVSVSGVSGENVTISGSNAIISPPASGWPYNNLLMYYSFSPRNSTAGNATSQVTYSITRYDYAPEALKETSTLVINNIIEYRKPVLSFKVLRNQPGYDKFVEWTAILSDSVNGVSNIWLMLQPGANNIADIKIYSVSDANGNEYDLVSDNGKMLVNLGSQTANTSRELKIKATYTNCGYNNVDTLWVQGGWTCEGDITSMSQVEVVDFNNFFTLTNKSANMQVEAYSQETPVGLCEDIHHQVFVNSTALGYMDELGFWINALPPFIQLKNNEVRYEYLGNTGVLPVLNLFDGNTLISSNVLYDNGHGTMLPGGSDTVKLDFDFYLVCDNKIPPSDIKNAIVLNTKGSTNCGDLIQYEHRFTPRVKGFEQVDSVKLYSTAAHFGKRGDTTTVYSSIWNISNTFIDSVYFEATLPGGIAYLPQTGTILNTMDAVEPFISMLPGNITRLVWALPPSQYIAKGDTVKIAFDVAEQMLCPVPTAKVATRSYLLRTLNGCGGSCQFQGTTDRDTARINVLPFMLPPVPAGVSNLCSGDSSVFISGSVPEAVAYQWGVYPAAAGTIDSQDTIATLYAAENYSGEADVFMVVYQGSCPAGDTVFASIEIHPMPIVTLADFERVGTGDAPLTLTGGSPEGGIYSGNGIDESPVFDPALAGPGLHTILYTYTTSVGCTASDSNTIEVSCNPIFRINPAKVCMGDTLWLTVSSDSISTSCDIDAWDFSLLYNENMLQYLGEYQLGEVSMGEDAVVDVIDDDNGFLLFSSYTINTPEQNLHGNGDVLRLKFLAAATGSDSVSFYEMSINGDDYYRRNNALIEIVEAPELTVSNDTTICAGSSVSVSAIATGTIVWNTGETTNQITVRPDKTTTYKVVVTNANGCSKADSVTVTVLDKPESDIPNDTICFGSATVLQAPAAMSYSWNTGHSVSSITVSPLTDSLYVVTITNAHGCTIADSIQVKVNALPQADAGNDTSVCPGSSATLTAEGGLSYTWSHGALTKTTEATPSAETVFFVTVTDDNGCSAVDSVTVGLLALPIVELNKDTALCAGYCVLLEASGGVSYAWNNSLSGSSINVCPEETTTWTVTVTNESKCSASDSVKVIVYELPEVNIGNDTATCAGETLSFTGPGSMEYTWNNGSVAQTISVTPKVDTLYILTVEDEHGCVSSDTVNVGIYALPQVWLGNDTSLCSGSQLQLAAPVASSYAWNTGDAGQSIIVDSKNSFVYALTITDEHGCKGNDSIEVTIHALPEANAGPDVTVCSGSSTLLTATGGVGYQWNTGATTSSIAISPATATLYIVTVTDEHECSDQDSAWVNLHALPTANAGIDQQVCSGESVNLSATGGITYQWSNGQNGNVITFVPSATAVYTVTATDANSCQDTDEVSVTVKPLPPVNVADVTKCKGEDGVLDAGVFKSYLWSTGSKTRYLTVSNPGIYTVTVTGTNNCKNSDQAAFIVIDNKPGLQDDTIYFHGAFSSAPVILDAGSAISFVMWTKLEDPDYFDFEQLIEVYTGGTYFMLGYDEVGCEILDTAVISEQSFIPGDADGDNMVTANDAELILDYFEGIIPGSELPASFFYSADIALNCGVVDINDADRIRDYLNGIITQLSLCNNKKAAMASIAQLNMYIQDNVLYVEKTGDLSALGIIDINVPGSHILSLGTPLEMTGNTDVFRYNFNENYTRLSWIGSKSQPVTDGAVLQIPIETTAEKIIVDYTYNTLYKTDTILLKSVVKENSPGESLLSIYPNPADEYVTIENTVEIVSIDITTLNGMHVMSLDNIGKRKETISTSGLVPGIYMVKITLLNNQVIHEKLTIE